MTLLTRSYFWFLCSTGVLMISNPNITQFVPPCNIVQLLVTLFYIAQFISTQTADSGQTRCLDTSDFKLKPCLTCLGSNPLRQQGFRRADLSPFSALQTVTFMNKLVIIISLIFFFFCDLFMLSNHADSSEAADSRCLRFAKWQKLCRRSRGSIPCSSLNMLKGWTMKTRRFTAGGPPDVGDGEGQIKAQRLF